MKCVTIFVLVSGMLLFSPSARAFDEDVDDPSFDLTAADLLISSAVTALDERAEAKCECTDEQSYGKCLQRVVKEDLDAFKKASKFTKAGPDLRSAVNEEKDMLVLDCHDLLTGDDGDDGEDGGEEDPGMDPGGDF